MRYFVGFLISLGLIIVLVLTLFRGGNEQAQTQKTDQAQTQQQEEQQTEKPQNNNLSKYAFTNSETIMILAGPIVASDNYREVRVIVRPDNVTFQVVKGYDNQVIDQRSFANNQASYENFLNALQSVGFNQTTEQGLNGAAGSCPLRQRYIFILNENNTPARQFWSSNCVGVGNYKGRLNQTIDLFQAQVPNYNDLTEDVDLN